MYVDALFREFDGRVRQFADFVVYWFEKARAQIESGLSQRAGLLATNSIRGGVNREVLARINETGQIYMTWSDEPWVLDGAAVRISIVGFDDGTEKVKHLDGEPAQVINSDLTSSVDITISSRLVENTDLCFMGPSAKAPFDITCDIAEELLSHPVNINARPNSDVVVPVVSAVDIVRDSRNKFTIDFGTMDLDEAAYYEAPFEHVRSTVLPVREGGRRNDYRGMWWQYARPRPELRSATSGLSRKIVTPGVSKYRIFVWKNVSVLANQGTLVFAREDDYLHSRAHELWSLRMGTWLGKGNDPRYTPTTTFETYPFPWAPGQEPVDDPRVIAIGEAAKALDDARNAWLNPPDTPEAELKKRTLTNLYNSNPTWLQNLHATLDRAVWNAYGWPQDETPAEVEQDVILGRLLALNLERTAGAS